MKKIFKHNKTGKLYQLEQNYLLCKTDVKSERVYYADSFDIEFKDNYEWDKNKADQLVLYKALYENEDGPYFVRYKKDFEQEFTQIKDNDITPDAIHSVDQEKNESEYQYEAVKVIAMRAIFSKKMWYEFFLRYKTEDSYLPEKDDEDENFSFYEFELDFPTEYIYDTDEYECNRPLIKKYIRISWQHEMDREGITKGRTEMISFDDFGNFIHGDDDYQPLIDWMNEQKEMEKDKQRQKDYELYLKLKKQFEGE